MATTIGIVQVKGARRLLIWRTKREGFRWVLLWSGLLVFAPVSSVAAQTAETTENPALIFRGVVSMCDSSNDTLQAMSASYITGFVLGHQAALTSAVVEIVAQEVARGNVAPTNDAIDAAAAKHSEELRPFCIRSTWTAGYVQAHVVQYALEHPDLLDEPSESQILKVLERAFPCSERQ